MDEDVLGLLFALCLVASTRAEAQLAVSPTPTAPITFNKHVAPIVFTRCASCHHRGGPAPFSLLEYPSARQHASQIAIATKTGYMPPWKADPAYSGEFVGQQPLSEAEINLIQQWVADGALEGDPRDLPPAPATTAGWRLGQPDLRVSTEPYTLQAEGTDVFRIFVIPLPVKEPTFVRGMEFHPENAVVHHANIRLDRTTRSRVLDQEDPAPGYSGLIARSATYPEGHFLGWTPGQVPPLLPKGLAWRLDPGTDLVVELHMRPSGKQEVVQPIIGFFFGTEPPTRTPAMLRLGRQNIDIAPGDRQYVVTDSFVLPVDVEVQAVQPHAHYHARQVEGTALLPDGTARGLISIKDWDFQWQHVFRYRTPFWLPKGTKLSMRYVYDNSDDNPRLPEHPPRRVRWGQRSADEMGDLWIQVLTRTADDLSRLTLAFGPKVVAEDIIGYEVELQRDPANAALHDDLAMLYLGAGQPAKAVEHFSASLVINPRSAAAHFNLGTALSVAGRLDEAAGELRTALAIDANYAVAHNNLGSLLLQRGDVSNATAHLTEAVRLDPNNPEGHYNLGRAYRASGNFARAATSMRKAVQLRPEFAMALADLSWLLASAPDDRVRDGRQAIRFAERAAALTERRNPAALDVLAAAYAETGDFDRAVAAVDEALRLPLSSDAAVGLRQRRELYRQHEAFRIH